MEVEKLSIFVVEKWNLRPEKLHEYNTFLAKWKKLVEKRPELFEEIKSWNSYMTIIGTSHSCMNLWEYERFSDIEKHMAKYGTDTELKEFVSELWTYLLPGSHRDEIWRHVTKLK